MKKKQTNSSLNVSKAVFPQNHSTIQKINKTVKTNVSSIMANSTVYINHTRVKPKRILTSNSTLNHTQVIEVKPTSNKILNHSENYTMNITLKKNGRRENEKLFRKDEKSKLFLQHKNIKALSSIEDEIKKISSDSGFKNCLELDKFNFKSFIEVFAVIVMISIVVLLFNYFTDYSVKSIF